MWFARWAGASWAGEGATGGGDWIDIVWDYHKSSWGWGRGPDFRNKNFIVFFTSSIIFPTSSDKFFFGSMHHAGDDISPNYSDPFGMGTKSIFLGEKNSIESFTCMINVASKSSVSLNVKFIMCCKKLQFGMKNTFNTLRLPHRNDAEIAKICNLWTFWLVIQPISRLFRIRKKAFCRILKRWFICRITDQNVQRLRIFVILASFLWGNLKHLNDFNSVNIPDY